MKKTLIALVGLFLLVSKTNGQVNWSVVMGKQRFSQGFALPVKDTLSYMAAMDSAAMVLRPNDSSLYYRYKGNWKKLGVGGGGGSQNLQSVLGVGNIATNQSIALNQSVGGGASAWSNQNGDEPWLNMIYNNYYGKMQKDAVFFYNNTFSGKPNYIQLGYDNVLNEYDILWSKKNSGNQAKYKTLLPYYSINQTQNHTYYLPDMGDTTAKFLVTSVNDVKADDFGNVKISISGGGIDSLKRSKDSVFARKNGVFIYQYKDSVGGGGGGGDGTLYKLVAKMTREPNPTDPFLPDVLSWQIFQNNTGVTFTLYHAGGNRYRIADNIVNPSQDAFFENVWLGGVQFKNDVYGNEHYGSIYQIDKHEIEIAIWTKSGQPETYVKDAMFEVRWYENAPSEGNVTPIGGGGLE